MVMGLKNFQITKYIKETFKMVIFQAMDNTIGQMVLHIEEIINMDSKMVREYGKVGLFLAISMKEITKTTRNLAMVFSNGMMEAYIKDIMQTIFDMDMGR